MFESKSQSWKDDTAIHFHDKLFWRRKRAYWGWEAIRMKRSSAQGLCLPVLSLQNLIHPSTSAGPPQPHFAVAPYSKFVLLLLFVINICRPELIVIYQERYVSHHCVINWSVKVVQLDIAIGTIRIDTNGYSSTPPGVPITTRFFPLWCRWKLYLTFIPPTLKNYRVEWMWNWCQRPVNHCCILNRHSPTFAL